MESLSYSSPEGCLKPCRTKVSLGTELPNSTELENCRGCATIKGSKRIVSGEMVNGKVPGRTKSARGDTTCRVPRIPGFDGFTSCNMSPVQTSRSVETDTGSVDSMDTCSGGLITQDNRDILSENAGTPPPSNYVALSGRAKGHQLNRVYSAPFAPPRPLSESISTSSSPVCSTASKLPVSPIDSPSGSNACRQDGSSSNDHPHPATSPSLRSVPELTCKTRIFYKTVFCPWYSTGRCYAGDGCNYAHEMAELRAKPDLRKTRLCMAYKNRGVCKDEACVFAHGEHELQRRDSGRTIKYFDGGRESCWGADPEEMSSRRKSGNDDTGARGGGRTSKAKDQRRASEGKGIEGSTPSCSFFPTMPTLQSTQTASVGRASDSGHQSSSSQPSAAAVHMLSPAPQSPPLITTDGAVAPTFATISSLSLPTSVPILAWYTNGSQAIAPVKPLLPVGLSSQETGFRHCGNAARSPPDTIENCGSPGCASAALMKAEHNTGVQAGRCFCADVAYLHATEYESIQSITRLHGVEAGKTYLISRLRQSCVPKAWTFFHYFSSKELKMSAPVAYDD